MSQAVVKIGGGALGAADTLFLGPGWASKEGRRDHRGARGRERGVGVAEASRGGGAVRAGATGDGWAIAGSSDSGAGGACKQRTGGVDSGVRGSGGGGEWGGRGIIKAEVRDSELGYVGRVTGVDAGPLEALARSGCLPVLSPIAAQQRNGSSDWKGFLNVNADTVAGELASAINASSLIFLTDVEGILDGDGNCVSSLTRNEAQVMIGVRGYQLGDDSEGGGVFEGGGVRGAGGYNGWASGGCVAGGGGGAGGGDVVWIIPRSASQSREMETTKG